MVTVQAVGEECHAALHSNTVVIIDQSILTKIQINKHNIHTRKGNVAIQMLANQNTG